MSAFMEKVNMGYYLVDCSVHGNVGVYEKRADAVVIRTLHEHCAEDTA